MFKKSGIIIFFILFFIKGLNAQEIFFLVDNSGSMAGYYDDKNLFKTFTRALINNTKKQNELLNVMLFSKTEQQREISSPVSIYEGNSSALDLNSLMQKFQISAGNDGRSGNTDLIEALDNAIGKVKGNQAMIWLITDNINDVSGTGDDSYLNTLEFYRKLRNDNRIQKILLYPIPEKVIWKNSVQNGYMIYGIIYSVDQLDQNELEAYDKRLRASGIKQRPITLKPLDIGTIILKPKITQSRISEGKLYYDGSSLKGFGFEEGEKVNETFTDLVLRSNLFPYKIESARLNVKLEDFQSSDYSVTSMGTQSISPSTVSNVSPEGEVTGFSLLFNMPEISPKFSLNTIFNDEFTIGGNLLLEVTQVEISLDDSYMRNFQDLFALQSVPEIFQPVLKDKKITTEIPLEIRMKYGPWRIYLLIAMIAFVVTGIILLIFFLLKKKCFRVIINESDEQDVCLSSFSGYQITDNYSPVLGNIKKSLTGSLSFIYSKHTLTPNRKVRLVYDLPIEIEYEEDNYKKEIATLMIRRSSEKTGEDNFEDSGSKIY